MRMWKTKAIQTDLGPFRQNQTYPRIIQAYSKPCATLAYLEPWHIQNHDISKIRNIFRILVYSEPRYIQNSGLFRIQGLLFRHPWWSVLWKQLTENSFAVACYVLYFNVKSYGAQCKKLWFTETVLPPTVMNKVT